jgi:hypothetical protein
MINGTVGESQEIARWTTAKARCGFQLKLRKTSNRNRPPVCFSTLGATTAKVPAVPDERLRLLHDAGERGGIRVGVKEVLPPIAAIEDMVDESTGS